MKIKYQGVRQVIHSVITVALMALSAPGQSASQLYFIHNDHLGTPQVVTDENQQVVWRGRQQPFGKTAEETSAIEQNTRFPGQYFDEETGLHYNYFRDYDPSIGRYIQSDPRGTLLNFDDPQRQIALLMGLPLPEIGFTGLNQTYSYARVNPINIYDENGEFVVPAVLIVGAFIILYIADDIIDKCEKKCPDRTTREGNAEFSKCIKSLNGFLALYGASTGSTGAASTVGGATCGKCE